MSIKDGWNVYDEAPHVMFRLETLTLRCMRCPRDEHVDPLRIEDHNYAFSRAHTDCPDPPTPESIAAAEEAMVAAAAANGFTRTPPP